ncbi:brassinosteroid-responsive RING protein 1-like [Typha angustifolia]|uniref:brassinosteroid-responsive RING protein 1-like n=1 Tax=Typha angustifolia TaxID=59011 RepID=UPI003C3029D9
MGFPSVCYCVILPKPLILVIQFLDCIKHAFFLALFYLGLSSGIEDYASPLSAAIESLASPSPPITASTIKARLRVLNFERLPKGSCHEEEKEEDVCAVCLGLLQARDEVRELGNCLHAFHKGCVDKWVDMGQVTCPLCRALLLPEEYYMGGE